MRDRPSSSAAPAAPSTAPDREPVIRVRDLVIGFGDKTIMNKLNLDVRRGEVMGFVGGSGMGKSVLTRAILGLIPKRSGTIELFGRNIDTLSDHEKRAMRSRYGVMFQQGALFSGLTVKQNVQAPMREYLDVSPHLMDELAMLKIELVGLPADAADKYPSALSGGMIKRAALARALALDPDLVFLDEPTSGLDPIGAAEFDELIQTLQRTLGLTVFMVTHDLDSLYAICDRIAALADQKVIAAGPMDAMLVANHPWLRAYFHGKRGSPLAERRAAQDTRRQDLRGQDLRGQDLRGQDLRGQDSNSQDLKGQDLKAQDLKAQDLKPTHGD